MTIKIIDNCLSLEAHDTIKTALLESEFPWYYNSAKVDSEGWDADPLNNYQFTHVFYNDMAPISPYIELLHPVMSILNPAAILRIKANLTPRTENLVNYKMHIDAENFKGKTAIYYVNDNNGSTIFEDKSVVESKENRLVIFDSQLLHAGTTCTNQKIRCVINFNYFNWATS